MGQDILSLSTSTGEPKRRYATKYYITDSTGDGVPEMHVWGHLCTVFTFNDSEMTMLDPFEIIIITLFWMRTQIA